MLLDDKECQGAAKNLKNLRVDLALEPSAPGAAALSPQRLRMARGVSWAVA
jgi:hypothetical protein